MRASNEGLSGRALREHEVNPAATLYTLCSA
jgi:hypothetical protein